VDPRPAPDGRAGAEALARQLRSPLVIGALDRTADGAELNAAYAFAPALAAVVYKRVLVPFGEHLPAPALWTPPGWRPPVPRRAGPSPLVIDVGARLAPSICFEAILPGHFTAATRAGAEILFNLSDDTWFASAWAAAQHLEMTRLRAVETRRWLVRASHSGISAVIDDHGAVVATLPYGSRGSLVRTVARGVTLTPYARWGNAPLLSGCAVALLLAAARGTAAARSHARSNRSTSASSSART
jgi:apolipoprotein N-acyltransferase